MKTKSVFRVMAWESSSSYDAGNHSDRHDLIEAESQSRAEDIFSARLQRQGVRPEVIDAEEIAK